MTAIAKVVLPPPGVIWNGAMKQVNRLREDNFNNGHDQFLAWKKIRIIFCPSRVPAIFRESDFYLNSLICRRTIGNRCTWMACFAFFSVCMVLLQRCTCRCANAQITIPTSFLCHQSAFPPLPMPTSQFFQEIPRWSVAARSDSTVESDLAAM